VPQQRSGRGTRPTTDRVRESLFNLLAARLDFDGADVLDLYAGSGALGLEALSRGARSAVFVESDPRAAAVIERNIDALGVRGGRVRRATVASVVAAAPTRPVDLVLADPPYEVPTDAVAALLRDLLAHGWIAPGAVVVVERPANADEIDWPAGLSADTPRRYGDTRLEIATAP
jgi:16S rRNA (guanine966-N2)-methyltransferase